jgi:transposase-like protein
MGVKYSTVPYSSWPERVRIVEEKIKPPGRPLWKWRLVIRHAHAAVRFVRRLLKGQGREPR